MLAEWRSRRGLTQDDVARLVHSTRSTVANVERGRQVVDRVFWAQCGRSCGPTDLSSRSCPSCHHQQRRFYSKTHKSDTVTTLPGPWGVTVDD
ncbi:helix-turn-helix transcriptional regulator [Micromonospora humidisoli]|uniref:helix-turn-helix transcriptional regulator n=1 Tax=Micromonospora humidisoli TaxID=2807622 RepID=UPI00210282DC|nr:helix-turn-helix transcriptional regulator [Micromonospora humidisoli]